MILPRLPVLLSACLLLASHAAGKPLNLVLITADDMNWDSAGCNGCTIPGITPNIDRLAAEGILFREAHATVPVCQPVRATMSTGLYPFHQLGGDASQRGNKIANPACAGEVKEIQQRLAEWMDKQGDPLREAFAKRHDKEFMRQFNQGLRKRSKR